VGPARGPSRATAAPVGGAAPWHSVLRGRLTVVAATSALALTLALIGVAASPALAAPATTPRTPSAPRADVQRSAPKRSARPAPGPGAGSVAAASVGQAPAYTGDFPDPFVLPVGTTYYGYSTQVGDTNVPVATSGDLTGWILRGDAMPRLASWVAAGRTWAPSVVADPAGGYILFYTAEDAATGLQCLGRATSPSPAGPFVDPSTAPFVCQSDLGGSIDPYVFTDGGRSFLLWKNDGNAVGVTVQIWSQALDATDQALTGQPTALLTADQLWEDGVIEAPAMVTVGSGVELFFSGGDWGSANYSIGAVRCTSPSGPCDDTATRPLLGSGGAGAGPGSPSIFSTAAGQLMMAYCAWINGIGYPAGARALFITPLTFPGEVPTLPAHPELPGVSLAAFGSVAGAPLRAPVIAGAATPDGRGYWLAAADGGVFAFGEAGYAGSTGGLHLTAPIVGMAGTADGRGYWLVGADGGVFAFGDAPYLGSTGGLRLNAPIVGMAATTDSRGYWLVARDGGIFAFGDAGFRGSMGGRSINQPVVGIAADPVTGGYWLVARDGGIFAFGSPFFGSTGAIPLNQPITGMGAMPDGGGYRFVAFDGGVFCFGDANFAGSAGGTLLPSLTTSLITSPGGLGYWLIGADGSVRTYGAH